MNISVVSNTTVIVIADDDNEDDTGPKPMLPYSSMFIFGSTNP